MKALTEAKARREAIKLLDEAKARRAPSMAGGLSRSFAQGAMFGFADEAEAAIRSLWDRGEDESFGSAYYRNRNQVRSELAQFREENMAAALTAELVGGFAVPGLGTAAGAAKALRTAPTLGRMALVGAGFGAAEGGLYGAGIAEDVSDIPGEAATGALIGGVVGAAVPPLVELVKSAITPTSNAARRLAKAFERDGTTAEQVAAKLDEAQKLGRPATIADVAGENARRELEVAIQSPGKAAQAGEKFLSLRNRQQLQRLSFDLVRGTGAKATDVEQAIATTMETRARAAAPVYERAMGFAAELDDDLVDAYNTAISTPLGKKALAKAKLILNVPDQARKTAPSGGRSSGQTWWQQAGISDEQAQRMISTVEGEAAPRSGFDAAPLMERIDALKRGLDDIAESSKRAGDNAIARRAVQTKHDLVGLVDDVNPDYKKARQIWENESGYLDAIDRGREILAPKFTAAKLQREVADMTDAEKEAFRIGAVDAIITRMRSQAAQEPNLLKIIRSPEMMDKITAVMDPKQAEKFRKIVDIEESMFRTASQARGNSATARRLAVMTEQEKELRLAGAIKTILGMVIEGPRILFMRALPAIPRAMRDRLLAQQNAIVTQRLLGTNADTALQGVSRVPTGPTGAAAIAPATLGGMEATGAQ